ncbi:hypothetical protein HN681_00670 [archaeon]|jgi:hypothetical protein|nr:hypothetical protein [archaeon]MBT3731073.1 hypothetical protein [archaeon]MBT4670186.1 hypothetical protein [archaeon]MBT5030524.1 hypothetical protein [archaeon]MBT5287877.1 hypothetical protein [archaeon]
MIKISKLSKQLRYHLTDTTALLIESNPFFALYEVGVAGMTDEVSLDTRINASKLAYLGLGTVYGRGRDLWRYAFKITDQSSEKKQTLHDMAYTGVFNIIISPPLYYYSGETDWGKIAIGSACSVVLGAANGIPMGYAVDAFRDLTSLEKCERKSYPNFLKKQTPLNKLAIAAGLAFLSLNLMENIYDHVPNNFVSNVYEQITNLEVKLE